MSDLKIMLRLLLSATKSPTYYVTPGASKALR